jgi:hypothetical protein
MTKASLTQEAVVHTILLLSRDLKLAEALRASVHDGQGGLVNVDDFVDGAQLLTQLGSTSPDVTTAVVLDLPTVATAPGRLLELCAAIKKTRPNSTLGLVASATLWVDKSVEAWAQQLGANVIVPQVSAARWATTGGRLVSALLGEGHSKSPGVGQLAPPANDAESLDRHTQTQLIAACESSGFDLTALAQSMGMSDKGGVEIGDHSYHLSNYPECFIASDAVTWLAQKLDVPRELAVAKAQALQAAGLIYHVAREQVFTDDHLYFRIAKMPARWDIESFYALIRRPSGFRVADRPYLGEVYSHCFVGSEAVAWMIDHGFSMNEAMSVGQRLMDASLIHHVVNEHSFKNKELYYRFYRS